MKYLVGVLLIIAGIALGLYVGLYVLFIGGIVDVVEGVKADPVNGELIAWGIAKAVVLAEFVGGLIFFFLSFVGLLCFGLERKPRDHRIPPRGIRRV